MRGDPVDALYLVASRYFRKICIDQSIVHKFRRPLHLILSIYPRCMIHWWFICTLASVAICTRVGKVGWSMGPLWRKVNGQDGNIYGVELKISLGKTSFAIMPHLIRIICGHERVYAEIVEMSRTCAGIACGINCGDAHPLADTPDNP